MFYLLPPSCPKEFQILDQDSSWQVCNNCFQHRRISNDHHQTKITNLCRSIGFSCKKPEEAYHSDLDYLRGFQFPKGRKFAEQKWIECETCKKMRWVPNHLKQIHDANTFTCKDVYYSCQEPQSLPNETIEFLTNNTESNPYFKKMIDSQKELSKQEQSEENIEFPQKKQKTLLSFNKNNNNRLNIPSPSPGSSDKTTNEFNVHKKHYDRNRDLPIVNSTEHKLPNRFIIHSPLFESGSRPPVSLTKMIEERPILGELKPPFP